MLSYEEASRRLEYCPITGRFTWRVAGGGGVAAGDAAGSVYDGYLRIQVLGKKYRAHRLAVLLMTGKFPNGEVDHRDGNRSNNVWTNLRDVESTINKQNERKARINNKSCGLLGVTKDRGNRWRARISVDGIKKQLGAFSTPQEAHLCYVAAKRMLHVGNTL